MSLHKNILICGFGSIGSRHLNNLIKLGFTNLSVFTTNSNKFFKVPEKIKIYEDLDEALQQEPFLSFICNPTSLHVITAIKCAKAGSNLFIEKPLSDNLSDVNHLKEILNEKKIVCMIGYMMRFNPVIQKIKNIIESKIFGDVIHYHSNWGEYLPGWHPYEDYKSTYAGKKELGGGVMPTLSHDLDLTYWLFGMPKKIHCISQKVTYLDINTEAIADILFYYDENIAAHVHLNYLDNPAKRNILIRFTKGRVEYDIIKNKLITIKINQDKPSVFDYKNEFTRNDLFLKEVNYLLKSIEKNIKPKPSIEDGINILKIINHAKKSSNESK